MPSYEAHSDSDSTELEFLNKEERFRDEEHADPSQPTPATSNPRTTYGQTNRSRTVLAGLGWFLAALLGLTLVWKSGVRLPYVATTSPTIQSQLQSWHDMDNYFIFGDSYTTTFTDENTSPPYALQPIRQANGTFSSWPNWVHFLTEFYNTKTVQTINMARGGSTVDNDLVQPYLMGTSLKMQSEWMLREYGRNAEKGPAIDWRGDNTLFIIWLGVNDVALTHIRATFGAEHERPPLPTIFESYRRSIEELYANGARNFLFMTVPPVDRSHSPVPLKPWEVHEKLDETADIASFNARLFELRDIFNHEYTDVSASVFDAHRFFSRVLDGPADFPQSASIHNTTGICAQVETEPENWYNEMCVDGEPTRSYAWTGLHATFPLHNATAAQIVEDCLSAEGKRGFCV